MVVLMCVRVEVCVHVEEVKGCKRMVTRMVWVTEGRKTNLTQRNTACLSSCVAVCSCVAVSLCAAVCGCAAVWLCRCVAVSLYDCVWMCSCVA